jgi:hypothetical protein
METTAFRKLMDSLAKSHGYSKAGAAWFQDKPTFLFVLELQRSSYGRQYFLNIKVWLKDVPGFSAKAGEVPEGSGHIFRREGPEFSEALDLDSLLPESDRAAKIEALLTECVDPLLESFGSRDGILRCANSTPPKIFLLPNIREHLSA